MQVASIQDILWYEYIQSINDELGLEVPVTCDDFINNLKAVKPSGYDALANGGKDEWTLEVMDGVISPNYYGGNDFFNSVVAGGMIFSLFAE